MDEGALQRFLDAKGIDAEIIRLGRKTKTVEQAAVALQRSKDKIVKTLTFIAGLGNPFWRSSPGRTRSIRGNWPKP